MQLKKIDPAKNGKIRKLIFIAEKGYMLVDQVPKYYWADATVNPPKKSPMGVN